MLLGSIPLKLDRQYERAWVLPIFPTCTQLMYSIQSHSCLTQPPVLPSTSLYAIILYSPPQNDIYFQVCQSGYFSRKWFRRSHMVVKPLMYCTRKCDYDGGVTSASCRLQPPSKGSTAQVPVLEHETFSRTLTGTPCECTRIFLFFQRFWDRTSLNLRSDNEVLHFRTRKSDLKTRKCLMSKTVEKVGAKRIFWNQGEEKCINSINPWGLWSDSCGVRRLRR